MATPQNRTRRWVARAAAVLMGATMAPVAALNLAPATADEAAAGGHSGAGSSVARATTGGQLDLECAWGETRFGATVTTTSSLVEGRVSLQVSTLTLPSQQAEATYRGITLSARAEVGEAEVALRGDRELATAVPLGEALALPSLLGATDAAAAPVALSALTVQLDATAASSPAPIECTVPGADAVDSTVEVGFGQPGATGRATAAAVAPASVSGKVTVPAGIDLEDDDAGAMAYREYLDSWWEDGEEYVYTYWDYADDTEINADLTYSFPNLVPGRYKFGFEVWNVAAGWHGGPTQETATVVDVVASRHLTGIDATLLRLGSLSGTAVLAADGTPVSDAAVYAIDLETGRMGYGWIYDGEFQVRGLQPGEYVVSFDGGPLYRATYVGGDSEESATRYTIAQGQDVTGLSLRVDRAGAVQGWLSAQDEISVVWLYRKNGSSWDLLDTREERLDPELLSPRYVFGQLPAGTYRVGSRTFASLEQYWDALDQGGYEALTPTSFWPSASTLAAGQDVVVTAGEFTHANFATSPYGSISGRISAQTSLRMSDVVVIARRYDAEEDYWSWWQDTVPNADGTYRIDDLEPGTYRVEVTDDSGDFDRVTYPDADTVETGQDVQVTAGQDTPGISVTLTVQPSVSGTVRIPAGTLAADVEVGLFQAYAEGEEEWASWDYTAEVASNGTFTFPAVRAGTYFVAARDSSATLVWSVLGGGNAPLDGTPVPVRRGSDVTGLSLSLATGTMSGRVLDPAGKPVADVRVGVEVMRKGKTFADWGGNVWTDSAGRWTVHGIAGGSFRLLADPEEHGDLIWNWWGNARHFDQAPSIVVGAGQSRSGLDITVPRGGFVTGTIQATDLDPEDEDLVVYAFRLEGGVWRLYGEWGHTPEGTVPEAFATGLVHTGQYRFGLARDWDSYPAAFVGGTSLATATKFTVVAGQTLGGLKLVLPAGSKALPVPTSPVTEPPAPKPTVKPTPKPTPKVVTLVKKPKVTGKATVGKTLKASKGAFKATDSKAKVRVKFQWQTKKGTKAVNVKKATKSKLKLSKKLRKKQVRVRITVSVPGHKGYVFTTKWSKKVA